MRKFSSILLIFLFLLSLSSSVWASDTITTPATGYTRAEDVAYTIVDGTVVNWGARGEDCTFLTTYALDYYTTDYSWDVFFQLSGGTGTSDAYQSELYDALQDMMATQHTNQQGYQATRPYYQYTDCVGNDYSLISSFYSGQTANSTWDGQTYNREHVWPRSKCVNTSKSEDSADIMMLRATITSENSSRGNAAYGESSGYFDPGESVRGDCARMILYGYVRWGNTGKMWGTSGVMESLEILLKWMEEDPVDTWEMGRNDSVQSITGVRNVFVDFPEYAWLLFGQEIPEDLVTPSGSTATGQEFVASGTCGDNLTWTLDENGTLTISGTGAMYDYYYVDAPWDDYLENIKTVVIQSGVTSIGGRAFYACSSLTSINIPNGVTKIGSWAFDGCSSLTSINIPDGVTSIGHSTFSGCSSLTSIHIPDGVTSIGIGAFYGCSSLASIHIPDSVTSIGDSAFYGCTSLTSIDIPDSVTSIGNSAFYGCTSLTSIDIPDGVTSIGDWAFNNCSSLTSINIPDSVTRIGDGAFYYCSSLASINIPDGVTSIGSDTFCGCSSLTSINIPNSVTSIGENAFCGCSSLTSINIPNSVTSIGENAFYGCSSLTSINIPDGVTSIGSHTFHGCSSLTSINIPDGVTSIGHYTFYKCSSLASINIPDGVTSIGHYTFYKCSSLASINIPDRVTSIGDRAFDGCSSLWHVLYKGTEEQWNAINIDSANSALTDAIRHYNCTGEEEIDPVNKVCSICTPSCTHEWDAGTITKEPTCQESGVLTRKCTLCDATMEESVKAACKDENGDDICDRCGSAMHIPGSMDGDGDVDSDDAIYLLYHTFLPEEYPLDQSGDMDGDGDVDSDDAIYLLYHTFLPDEYPLP